MTKRDHRLGRKVETGQQVKDGRLPRPRWARDGQRPVAKASLSPLTADPAANRRPTRRSSAAGPADCRGSRFLGGGVSAERAGCSGRGQRDCRPGKLGPHAIRSPSGRAGPPAAAPSPSEPPPEPGGPRRSRGRRGPGPFGRRSRPSRCRGSRSARSHLAPREVADQRVDALGRRRVELAGRLIREQERWAVSAAQSATRCCSLPESPTCAGPIAETDAL